MITFFIMFFGALAGHFFQAIPKKANDLVQLGSTLLLIFLMGESLGHQDDFFRQLGELGAQSFLFFLLPTIGSAIVVYFLTCRFSSLGNAEGETSSEEDAAPSHDPMMFYAIAALLLGVGCGMLPVVSAVLTPLAAGSEWILYLLMFSVGISIGKQNGILKNLLRFNVKVLLLPAGIIIGSLAGGVLCGALLKYSLRDAIAISGGLGWYSLAGVTLSNLAGSSVGSVAFLSNLMREIASFIFIPFVAKHFNSYTCIAVAGATSEDTTLPMIMRYTDAETAVVSVLNGVLTSTYVPILFSLCY